jgi:hypothetical protein
MLAGLCCDRLQHPEAGTTIRLFNTDTTGTNPTHYHEYLRIDGQGTQALRSGSWDAPTRRQPAGSGCVQRHVLLSDRQQRGGEIIGLYQIGFHHSNGFAVYPTINSPSYIIVEGLAFRNAYPTTDDGATLTTMRRAARRATQWGTTASCIRPYEGNHVTVRGNDMEDCSVRYPCGLQRQQRLGRFLRRLRPRRQLLHQHRRGQPVGAHGLCPGLPSGDPGQRVRPTEERVAGRRVEDARCG